MSTKSHQCQSCQATYSSSSHLRRHEAIHLGQRAFSCHFCNRRFFRADIARRHSKSCVFRGNKPLPEVKPRGKKKQGCSMCTMVARGCDQTRLSETCCSTGSEIGYGCSDSSDIFMSPEGSAEQPQPQTISPDLESGTASYPRISIEFLLNYTKPEIQYRSLPDFFGILTPREDLHKPLPSNDTLFQEIVSTYDSIDEDTIHSFVPTTIEDYSWDEITSTPLFRYPSLYEVRLQARLSTLTRHLEIIYNNWEGKNLGPKLDLGSRLFSVENLLEARRMYFSAWNVNVPVLHQPSFDLETISLPLLFAFLLVGSTFSEKHQSALNASTLHNLAEEYVFENEEFLQILQGPRQHQTIRKKSIEILQAAYLVSLLQNWKNDIIARRRMRTVRYCQIVSAVRMLGLTSIKNPYAAGGDYTTAFDWEEYIKAESMVRLTFAVYMNDLQFTVFYLYPPRFVLSELSGHLPSSDEAYEAVDSATCKELLRTGPNPNQLSLPAIMNILLYEDWGSDKLKYLETLECVLLFGLINALSGMIFIVKGACLGFYNREPIERGLSNWSRLWDRYLGRTTPEKLERIGFMKSMKEFCDLARLFWNDDIKAISQLGPDTDSMDELHEMLQKFRL